MITDYEYAKLCDSARLRQEISASAIVTAIDHIETSSTPYTKIFFKDALSPTDEDLLDDIVNAHVNIPLPENTAALITTGKSDPVFGREIFAMSAFAVNTDYEVKATGFKATVTAGQTVDIDHPVGAEDRYINGVGLYCLDAAMGDTADLFVVDKNRFYAGILYPDVGEGEVTLKQFGFDVNIFPATLQQFVFNYLARIPQGVFIRLRYKSIGGADVKVGINLFLHKKAV